MYSECTLVEYVIVNRELSGLESTEDLPVYIKAPLCICMKNKARGGVLRDKYSTRQSRVLYLSRDTSRVLYFSYRQARRCFN